ncbi:hypothetical protein MMC21_003759 [Puttea exsequens]|nr:hypothetical protein [Puttea exsequens]
MTSHQRSANVEVVAEIERVFENIADGLLGEEPISIPLRYKKQGSSLEHSDSTHPSSITHVTFPSKTPGEARRFAVLLRILELIHEVLCDGVVVSKRNIYYKDPALFKDQSTVDRYVDILAYTFGVPRAALNVTAAAKGLVIGRLTLVRRDGSTIDPGAESPHLIDDINKIQNVDISYVSWILVVEKEVRHFHCLKFLAKKLQSTFRTLASANLHMQSRAGSGILLTAKGYPDISTRSFLRLLSTSHDPEHHPPPIYALTDFDPDGLAIMSTYKHGSLNLSHENFQLSVSSIEWLGIQISDILHAEAAQTGQGLLRLSGRDRRKAIMMLDRSKVLGEDGEEQEWRRELQVMLMLNVKAEMEILSARDGGVAGWVEQKLFERRMAVSAGVESWDEEMLEA